MLRSPRLTKALFQTLAKFKPPRRVLQGVRAACSTWPNRMGLAMQHARIAMAREDWPEAVARWRRILERFPADAPVEAHVYLSRVYRKQRDSEAAEAVVEAAICRYPDELSLGVEYAKVAELRKDWPQAVARCQRIIERFGGGAPAETYVLLSKAHRRLCKFDAAEAIALNGRSLHPACAELWMEFADTAMARQDWPEAVRRWQALVREFGEKTPVGAWLRTILAFRLEGNVEAAAKYLRRVSASNIGLSLDGYGPIKHTIERAATPNNLGRVTSKICVHLHLYHTQFAELFVHKLKFFDVDFNLFVSIAESEDRAYWTNVFLEGVPKAVGIVVKPVPNRGRDVKPWLCTFRDEIRKHDLLLHIHTKASQQDLALLWNYFLVDNMCGSPSIIHTIINLFEKDNKLGLIYPPYFNSLRGQPNWGVNKSLCAQVYTDIFGEPLPVRCPDYPAGSFFWARTRYLKPLFDLGLSETDFPAEAGQTDKTLAHAVERIIGTLDRHTGMTKECVSTTPTLSVADIADFAFGAPPNLAVPPLLAPAL